MYKGKPFYTLMYGIITTLLLFVQVNPPAWGVNQSDFVIHGVWPEWTNSSWPQYCCNSSACEYKASSIASLTSNLTQWWTDFHNPPALWRHEWQRHGTCSGLFEYDYFLNGLLWREQNPMREMLQQAQLEPGTLYTTKNFIDRLAHVLDALPVITCQSSLLEQVIVCYLNGTIGDCPSVVKNSCGDSLYY